MGSIANTYLYNGLIATGTPVGNGVSGKVSLGQTESKVTLTDADVFYIFKVTSTGASDVATLNLDAGTVAQTTGTPTIVDGDGKDFEGETLGTMVSLQGLHVDVSNAASGTVQIADNTAAYFDVTASADSTVNSMSNPTGLTITGDSLVITFDTIGQVVTVIVAGKTT